MNSRKMLLGILIFNVLSTALHYTDNAIFVDVYPELEWFTTSAVFAAWAVMTPVAFLGDWLYQRQQFILTYLALAVYSITSVSSPGHYLYPGAMEMRVKMHLLIWFDGIAGLCLIAFLGWSVGIAQEWRKVAADPAE